MRILSAWVSPTAEAEWLVGHVGQLAGRVGYGWWAVEIVGTGAVATVETDALGMVRRLPWRAGNVTKDAEWAAGVAREVRIGAGEGTPTGRGGGGDEALEQPPHDGEPQRDDDHELAGAQQGLPRRWSDALSVRR